MKLTDSVQAEYWHHVADQIEIPIAGKINKSIDIDLLKTLADSIPLDKENIRSFLTQEIQSNTNLVDILRTLIGISDKRMYLELSYCFSKERYNRADKTNILNYSIYDLQKKPLNYFKNLIASDNKQLAQKSLNIIVDYVISRGIDKILYVISKLNSEELKIIVEKLIITKEIQQAEAKRRGHGAEFELAKLINSIGLKMAPEKRYVKPIGLQDPNVDKKTFRLQKKKKGDTWSFDLIIRDVKNDDLAFVQSLIHTSDPGQYGVNKSDETLQIKKDIITHNSSYKTKKELWGIVDGVGFCENKKDTIDKMLNTFDCFIQMKSLYKAALRLHRAGYIKVNAIAFNMNFYSTEEADLMYKKYCTSDIIKLSTNQSVNSDWVGVDGGMAKLFL